ncbi:hypothetical protein [Psychrobacter phenylpyruvicus]|uniref:Uncharacterized protein n=1 Tax=Psychrobacter phenylpyruvicus TaxID=29432 RepID=A0A379LL43_9GAMM|nr:hypothetical protein [Psychrobacter phenylpyruvicus]SUD91310.1 Uncharacterised protein [Psychrobacter phenylpyruvicus]
MPDAFFATIRKVENKLLSDDEVIFCGQGIHIFNPILKDTLIIDDRSDCTENQLNKWTVTFLKTVLLIRH